MPKSKQKNKNCEINLKKVNGISINGVIFSFKTSEEFLEALPGIKLWLAVENKKGNS